MMTRILNLAGAALPKNLLPPAADNENGFWESWDFVTLNDQILDALGIKWDSLGLREYMADASAIYDRFYSKAAELISAHFDGEALIVLKDPRISIIPDFWEKAFKDAGFQVHYVVMYRTPVEVASSLRTRNNFSLEKGALMWVEHYSQLLRNTTEEDRTLVDYEAARTNWGSVIERLHNGPGLRLLRITPAVKQRVSKFIKSDAKHEAAAEVSPSDRPECLNRAERLYRVFSEPGGDGIDRFDKESGSYFSDLSRIIAPLYLDFRAEENFEARLAAETARITEAFVGERDALISAAVESRIADHQRQTAEMTQRVQEEERAVRKGLVEALGAEYAANVSRLESESLGRAVLVEQLQSRVSDLDANAERLTAEYQAQIVGLETDRATRVTENEHFQAQIAEMGANAEQLTAQHQAQIANLETDRATRITENEHFQAQIAEMGANAEQLTAQYQAQIANLQTDRAARGTEIEHLRAQISEISANAERLTAENAARAGQLEQADVDRLATDRRHTARLDQMRAENEEASGALHSLSAWVLQLSEQTLDDSVTASLPPRLSEDLARLRGGEAVRLDNESLAALTRGFAAGRESHVRQLEGALTERHAEALRRGQAEQELRELQSKAQSDSASLAELLADREAKQQEMLELRGASSQLVNEQTRLRNDIAVIEASRQEASLLAAEKAALHDKEKAEFEIRLQSLTFDAKAARRELEMIRSSRAWRLTLPLRRIGVVLRGRGARG